MAAIKKLFKNIILSRQLVSKYVGLPDITEDFPDPTAPAIPINWPGSTLRFKLNKTWKLSSLLLRASVSSVLFFSTERKCKI